MSGSQRSLRACMVCSLVQPYSKFMREGCPNCEELLELRGNSEQIQDCTSQVFEGLITMQSPQESWVAKWQRLQGYVPGVYAVKVEGVVCERMNGSGLIVFVQLPDDIVATIENSGMKWIPRDGSGMNDDQ